MQSATQQLSNELKEAASQAAEALANELEDTENGKLYALEINLLLDITSKTYVVIEKQSIDS